MLARPQGEDGTILYVPTSKEEKDRVKRWSPKHRHTIRNEADQKGEYLKSKQRAELQIVEEGHRARGIVRCTRPGSARPAEDRNNHV